jgi:hypothetical protein
VFVCKARKKMVQASGGRDYIETVRGRGYTLRGAARHESRPPTGSHERAKRQLNCPGLCSPMIVASVRRPDEVMVPDDTILNDTYSEMQYDIGRAAAASVND